MSFGVVALAAVALLLALPFIAELFRAPMTAARQSRAPGRIADLPMGATHYTWSGPEGAPVAVCIHGLSTPSYVFAATERHLAGMGFRVLTFDLYGRGYSDRPRGAQTLDFFLQQLRDLLRHQKVGGPLVLVGFSLGAQIAIAFASEEGPRVRDLVLVAPAGLNVGKQNGFDPWTAPLIGDWLTRVAGGWMLRRELIEHKVNATVIPDLEDRQAAETRTRGFLPALLSSRRHVLTTSSAEDLRHIHHIRTRTLAIWGTLDPVVPSSLMGRLAELHPDAHHVQISGAAHNLLQTHPTQVAQALDGFLTRNTVT
ncbi:MAG: alpha/beta hydrolase [Silicimonas sp.]|nr:alpha/beta hydrolase [Silicimonas sp.]